MKKIDTRVVLGLLRDVPRERLTYREKLLLFLCSDGFEKQGSRTYKKISVRTERETWVNSDSGKV